MKSYFTHKNNTRFILAFVLQTIQTLLVVLVAVLLSILIDAVSDSIQTGDTAPLIKILLICIAYAVLLGLAVFCTERQKSRCIMNAMTALKKDVMSAILNKEIMSYHTEAKGTYLSMLSHNMNLVEENYFKNFFTIYESLLRMVLAAIVLIVTNPIVALFSLICTCIPTVIPKLFTKKLSAMQAETAEKASDFQTQVTEILDGYELIKNYSLEEQMQKRYQERSLQAELCKYKRECIMAELQGIANMASILAQFLIMLFAGFLATKGYITLGSIVAVTQLSGQVITPASQLTAMFGLLTSIRPVSAKIMELVKENDNPLPIGETKTEEHEISFRDVSFSYGEQPVLKHIHLTLEKGKKYALTGNSGSGKSTILKLLMQYYPTYEGQILIDGTELKEYGCFFKQCAYVGQEVFLLNDTIEHNICLYQEPDTERLAYAIRESGLETVLEQTDKGVQTMTGENGSNFSGGERQRIAIARALYHNKRILLFDEATSALDSDMAEKIENLILNLRDVTCLFVSHKLSASCVERYDSIIRLGAGSVSA
ncbi:MAG: ABC transporter ATP-binding protein [Lachnospiraceae bacterium]|nr:ABC transporter ATP-binding protein [Lachnospiraceae bacterium]